MISSSGILGHLQEYTGDFLQFMFPLPLGLYMLWHWGRNFWKRSGFLADPTERFILFISVVVLGNIFILTPAPQGEMRYLVHLYPLCSIVLAWVICRAWSFHKFSGALLGVVLVATNFLYVLPMEWLGIINQPVHDDQYMLVYPNIPLKLYLTEISSSYPDVNQGLIRFFQTHARPGQTILTVYGDLPLEFYTSCKVIGGLQGHKSFSRSPDWVVPRWYVRWNRKYNLDDSEKTIRQLLAQPGVYRPVTLHYDDEIFGDRPDPYFHRFIPPVEPVSPLIIYEKIQPAKQH